MRVGKLSSEELQKYIISKTTPSNGEVVQSAGVAEDCAAVKCGGVLLLTTDPITAAGVNCGKLAIVVSANDVASGGGVPFACLLTIIAPVSSTAEAVGEVMTEAYETASAMNVDIIGGHTEFSDSVNRIVVNCVMLGKTDKIVRTGGAVAGDSIIMTKTAGIEATAVIGADFADELLSAGVTAEEIDEAKSYIEKISVAAEGAAVVDLVSGMHDVTEGGVFGAVAEMCRASDAGAVVCADDVPVTDLTKKLCKVFNLDYFRLISSGSMLMTTDRPDEVIGRLKAIGVRASVIGKITKSKKITAVVGDREIELFVTPDELLKLKR